MVNIIVGSNWGDEGKGKMVDYLAKDADIVARFQGGNNAGHTIINEYGKFALHLLPSGIFYPHVVNILGPGVALNIVALAKEIEDFQKKSQLKPKLLISNRAQVLMPYHVLFDVYEEERLKNKQFGSTKSGIAPFYSDKYAKIGLQIGDMFEEESFTNKLKDILEVKNILLKNLYKKPEIKVEEILPELRESFTKVKEYICDTNYYLYNALKEGKEILMEGQLGALRDPDHGIYPYSTSSSTLAGYSTVGGGVPVKSISEVIAVVKAYSSCVGAGPFVTELMGEEGQELRNRGGDCGEYGATTGRPRSVGWFDCVATRYGCMVQGATQVALTLIDVLGYLDKIKVCTAYEIEGKIVDEFPATSKLYKAKPVYEELTGWKCDISGIKKFDDLPVEAKEYIRFIENKIGVKIKWISNGPKRDSIIKM